MYRVTIDKETGATTKAVAQKRGDVYEIVQWLQHQIKWLRKEPYMVPRFDGEEPLEGLKWPSL